MKYIFESAEQQAEFFRLTLIEEAFDPKTQELITKAGIAPEWRCLEVGSGGGSITNWLSSIVADQGKIVAIDLLGFSQIVK